MTRRSDAIKYRRGVGTFDRVPDAAHDKLCVWTRAWLMRLISEAGVAAVPSRVELEAPLIEYGKIVGFFDVLMTLPGERRFIFEIKTGTLPLGETLRQLRLYEHSAKPELSYVVTGSTDFDSVIREHGFRVLHPPSLEKLRIRHPESHWRTEPAGSGFDSDPPPDPLKQPQWMLYQWEP